MREEMEEEMPEEGGINYELIKEDALKLKEVAEMAAEGGLSEEDVEFVSYVADNLLALAQSGLGEDSEESEGEEVGEDEMEEEMEEKPSKDTGLSDVIKNGIVVKLQKKMNDD